MSTQTAGARRAVSVLCGKMRRLAREQVELERAESELNTRLEAVRGVYAQRITRLRAGADRLRDGIEQFCRRERAALLNGGARSVVTPHGKVGFRRTGPQVVLEDGRDVEEACHEMCGTDLAHLVRARHTLDKSAIKRALERGEVAETALARCGVRVTQGGETFYCQVEAGEGRGQ